MAHGTAISTLFQRNKQMGDQSLPVLLTSELFSSRVMVRVTVSVRLLKSSCRELLLECSGFKPTANNIFCGNPYFVIYLTKDV